MESKSPKQSNNKMMSSSGKSNKSEKTIQFEEHLGLIINEIKELPQQEEQSNEQMYDKIRILEKDLKNEKLSEDEQEKILFKILKYKCLAGAFYNREKHRTCNVIRKEMQQVMGDYSVKYCFLVYLGLENSASIHIMPTVINQDKYFKVTFQTYTYLVYEILRQPTLDYESVYNGSVGSQTSIDLNIKDENSNSKNQIKEDQSKVRCKASSFMSSSNKQISSDRALSNKNIKKVQEQVVGKSQFQSNSQREIKAPQSSQITKKKRDSILITSMNNSDQRKNTSYLIQQIQNDEKRLQKSKMAQQKYVSTLVEKQVPSKDQLYTIAKNYTDYMDRPVYNKPFTAQDYAIAVQKAFHAKCIQPKLIIVKREPRGDYFWNYDCENDVTLHTWDLLKNEEKCVVVVV